MELKPASLKYMCRKQRTANREPQTENRKQRTANKEPRTENRNQCAQFKWRLFPPSEGARNGLNAGFCTPPNAASRKEINLMLKLPGGSSRMSGSIPGLSIDRLGRWGTPWKASRILETFRFENPANPQNLQNSRLEALYADSGPPLFPAAISKTRAGRNTCAFGSRNSQDLLGPPRTS